MKAVAIPTFAGVESIVHDFWQSSPENRLYPGSEERAWDKPHFAVARGDDPLFARIKEMIGPFHWTPDALCSVPPSQWIFLRKNIHCYTQGKSLTTGGPQ